MKVDYSKQAGLMAGLALNEVKGLAASQLYPIIRSYTGNSFAGLIYLLKSASNGQCDNYSLLTAICIAVNEISPRSDMKALCVYSANTIKLEEFGNFNKIVSKRLTNIYQDF
jgi:hypothetical protein